MKISVLGSGSTGNSVLLVANGTRVLVDAGLSARETARRMSALGEDPNSLDGILITHEGVNVATLMDFGHITTLITERLRGCAAIVIESNHSRDMLKTVEHYPWELKQRILSRLGHLSNEDVADWLVNGFDGQARHVVLAHLSQRANNSYLAKITAETALRERAPLFPASTEVTLSFPKEATAWI